MKLLAYLGSALLAIALFVVGASGQAVAQGGDDPIQAEAGAAVYEASCSGCHGDDGTGVAGRGRPLIGIASQGDRATHIASVADGKGGMPAFDARLSSEEIEQAVSYVRLTFVEAEATPAPAATEELARTGIDSAGLAVIGTALVVGGAGMVGWSRRRQL